MPNVDLEQGLAFPKLSDAEIERLRGLARTCTFRDGETIIEAGQRGMPLYVVDSSTIAIPPDSTT
jgi:hypothetical protein